jgi:GT2 family glycosyltransferase
MPDVVMTYGTTEYWFDWDGPAGSGPRDQPGKLGVEAGRAYRPPSLLTAYLRDPGIVPCVCALLVRREVVLAAGCFDESFQDLYEDQVLIAKIVLSGDVFVDSACGERYRQHAGSSSAVAEREGRYHPTNPNPARKAFLEWVKAFTVLQQVRDRQLDRALRAALNPYRPAAWRRLFDWS